MISFDEEKLKRKEEEKRQILEKWAAVYKKCTHNK